MLDHLILNVLISKKILINSEPSIDGSTMIISSADDFQNSENLIQQIESKSIETIKITGDSITEIPSFVGLKKVKFVNIDASQVTKIPDYCFYNSKKLKEVTIHQGLTGIGDYAFAFTTIEKINLENVNNIGPNSFAYCSQYKDLKIPQLSFIESFSNSGVINLTLLSDCDVAQISAYLPYLENVNIKKCDQLGSFSLCPKLKSILFQSEFEFTISQYSFSLSSIANIDLKNAKTIGSYSFENSKIKKSCSWK
ncbi:Leucine Rich Repeat family protein [Trichomonas vaginalis G3]|uniref:Leucine Rich Repeat family protein n=1 Tax=Trichomonas vaginalis (strain ATCC PRA-98 / G3) TaxID=412133 RepID=A2F5M7_TRIV3|nr:uncharacterized protein TVAGG3_1055580 [Trichomonas vaginalis G3]EAX99790.1 Leucine Rich Repeat family protein [Trichomonas vaginalis G3]KAI5494424.1 BspA type Leucine rich repeat region (6 copies) family [Trichomonas vaginalis G3]|eukprot:XP_001312720.1 hypothetical protein [Trichomonas vaginalis G3]